jgi:hypothetical protein
MLILVEFKDSDDCVQHSESLGSICKQLENMSRKQIYSVIAASFSKGPNRVGVSFP